MKIAHWSTRGIRLRALRKPAPAFSLEISQSHIAHRSLQLFAARTAIGTFENKKMPRPVVTGIKSLIDRRGEDLDELEDVPSRASGQYQLELGRSTANK